MAADTIIIKYRADTAKFSQDTKALTTDLTKVGVAGDKAGDKTTASFNKAAAAIDKTGKQTKQTTGSFNGMASSLSGIAASMGLAFGVQQVIQFGKASVEAFIDAEKNAQLLLFALKGNEAAQGRLMAQASELQNTTVFDDDTIQQAQAFLANQGRTEEQIKKVINAAVELSTVTGVDLNTAVMQLDGTFEGNIGKMGKLDSAFKGLTKEQLANGAAADLLIEKYGGTAKAMGETTAGQVAKLKNQFGELQETIGGEILPVIQNMVDGLSNFGKGNVTDGITNYLDHMQLVAPMIQEVREALEAFRSGKILEGVGNSFEAVASTITLGFYTRIKNHFIPGMKEVGKEMTDFEKAAIKVATATDAEIKAKFESLGGATNATAMEFKKFTDDMRQGILKNTLDELSKTLDIDATKFKELTDQTDKYGISVRVTADAILELKNATDAQLEATFLNAQKTLGVTREEWDKYIGTIKKIPPVTDDTIPPTIKAVGAYQKLANAVSGANTALQDQAALFIDGKATWDDVLKQAQKYADAQNKIVQVNDLITKSLERQETMNLVVGNSMDVVLIKYQTMIEKFKMSNEQIERRDEIFKELGLTQEKTTKDRLKELEELEQAELKSVELTLENIERITNKYKKAKELIKLDAFIEDLQEFQKGTTALLGGFTDLFQSLAEDSAAFVAFQKVTALIEIAISQAVAIASAIRTISSTSATPIEIIVGIATIVGSITSLIGSVVSTVNALQNPEPPQFYEGTDYLQLNGNPKGKDTIPVMAHEGEAIIPTEKNLSEPGLATAWINGNLDKYVIDKWVTPALINQEKEQKKEFAESIAASMLMQSGSNFDDYRLYRLGLDQVSLLSQNNKILSKVMQTKNPWAV